MIFDWLKSTKNVTKLIEVVVDDFENEGRTPHSDDAIIHCLEELDVECWDWRRMDISSDVISRAAGQHIKVVNLYCSGLNAVLRSWSDMAGLPSLGHVRYTHAITWWKLVLTDVCRSLKKSTWKPTR